MPDRHADRGGVLPARRDPALRRSAARRLTLLDFFLVALLVGAVVRGVRIGAFGQLLPLGGFVVGLVAGAAAAPQVERLVQEGSARVLLSLAVVLAGGILGSTAGQLVGRSLHVALARQGLVLVDRVVGAAAGAGLTALSISVAAAMLANVPLPPVAGAIQSSRVLRALDDVLPPAPAVLARVQGLLQTTGLPPVFAGLEPDPGAERRVAAPDEVAAAVRQARAVTFKVSGAGCGGVQTGSSFLAAPALVVTNAHVVAGIDRPVVHTIRGLLSATPVLFDPDLDIAVLRVRGVPGEPLPIVSAEVPVGTRAAALGYPGGGGFRALPAAVTGSYEAVGRDIYSRGLARRPVYELRSEIRAGNSGGPVVTPGGDVIGVVFSRSAWHRDVGFAIRAEEVRRRVDAAASRMASVDTGPCAA